MTQLIQKADRALADLVRGFRENKGTPNDLEDAIQVVHDAKNELLSLTRRVQKAHGTNKVGS